MIFLFIRFILDIIAPNTLIKSYTTAFFYHSNGGKFRVATAVWSSFENCTKKLKNNVFDEFETAVSQKWEDAAHFITLIVTLPLLSPDCATD